MKTRTPNDISGVVLTRTEIGESGPASHLKFFTSSAEDWHLSIRYLDRKRNELVNRVENLRAVATIKFVECEPEHMNDIPAAVRKIMPANFLSVGECRIDMPEFAHRKAAYIAICAGPQSSRASVTAEASEQSWLRSPDRIYFEPSAKQLGLRNPGQCRALVAMTRRQVELEINYLTTQFPWLSGQSELSCRTLQKLYFQILSGVANPLHGREHGSCETSSEMSAYVMGTRKNVRMEMKRERNSRFGLIRRGRRIVDGPLENIADRAESSNEEPVNEIRKRKRLEVEAMIHCLCETIGDAELMIRRLLDNEPGHVLALEYGVKYSTLRSRVRRMRVQLIGKG